MKYVEYNMTYNLKVMIWLDTLVTLFWRCGTSFLSDSLREKK